MTGVSTSITHPTARMNPRAGLRDGVTRLREQSRSSRFVCFERRNQVRTQFSQTIFSSFMVENPG
jgi:hypothetical protein